MPEIRLTAYRAFILVHLTTSPGTTLSLKQSLAIKLKWRCWLVELKRNDSQQLIWKRVSGIGGNTKKEVLARRELIIKEQAPIIKETFKINMNSKEARHFYNKEIPYQESHLNGLNYNS